MTLPSLRERKEDISLYINYYINYYRKVYGKAAETLAPDVRTLFFSYPWEGNVRELKNVIESMVIFAGEEKILTREHIPIYLLERMEENIKDSASTEDVTKKSVAENIYKGIKSGTLEYANVVKSFEEQIIKKALDECRGNESKAARLLGLPRQTLRYKIGRQKK